MMGKATLSRRRVYLLLIAVGLLVALLWAVRWADAQQNQQLLAARVPPPVFSYPAGAYADGVMVTLAVPFGVDADIIFSLDGSVPQPGHSPIYEQAIALRAITGYGNAPGDGQVGFAHEREINAGALIDAQLRRCRVDHRQHGK